MASKNNSGFTSFVEGFNYEADDAEAVVYMIFGSGRFASAGLYVMKRSEAQGQGKSTGRTSRAARSK